MSMRRVTFSTGTPGEEPLLEVDLGEPVERYFDQGELAVSSGNLYIHVDGVEWGSLYFWNGDGKPTISLGQHDAWTEDWQDRNPLTGPVQSQPDPLLEKLITAAAWYWDAAENINDSVLAAQASLITEAVPDRPEHQNHQWVMLRIRNRCQP